MPMSHKDLWVKIKSESKGKSPKEELRLLEGYLADWPEYKGPYQELRKKLERRAAGLRKVGRVLASHSTSDDPFSVRKRGLAEIALVGLPNVGKTSVLNALTGADGHVADYPYTTLTPNIGMFGLGGFEFEIVDLPPFPEGKLGNVHYADGLKEACLNATFLCIVVDLTADSELQLDTLRGQLAEMEADKATVLIGTHIDAAGSAGLAALRELGGDAPVFRLPFREGEKRAIAEAFCGILGRIIVDARDPVSKEEPVAYALPEGASVLDLARQIHKDLARSARRARVWGPSASFDGQDIGLDHVLSSGDTV
ncbi:MAG: GTPase, partial [Candidatus Eisenbacteria bacterium]|nr:GTPase [Candidatus Eisenbacteria bacterium]